jgi:hypothetical protein
MILDYRIYCTLYALAFVGYFAMFPMIGHKNVKLFTRYLVFYVPAVVAVAFANYLDWLWA